MNLNCSWVHGPLWACWGDQLLWFAVFSGPAISSLLFQLIHPLPLIASQREEGQAESRKEGPGTRYRTAEEIPPIPSDSCTPGVPGNTGMEGMEPPGFCFPRCSAPGWEGSRPGFSMQRLVSSLKMGPHHYWPSLGLGTSARPTGQILPKVAWGVPASSTWEEGSWAVTSWDPESESTKQISASCQRPVTGERSV